jgi:hypothetical protein
MSDTRRIVTISSTGTVTVVKDLENASTYFAVAGSFTVKSADRQTVMAANPRRYAGQTAVAESHGNGAITWKAVVRGASPDLVIQNVEAMLAPLETPVGQHFEWRPDGATNSTFYEIRGPGTYSLTYDWAQFTGGAGMVVDVAIPVAPLAKGAVQNITLPSVTTPGTVAVATALQGDAPALCDLSLAKPGASPLPFALIGWTRRPTTPVSGSVVPFGLIQAETGNLSGPIGNWTVATFDAANLSNGSSVQINVSGAEFVRAAYAVDPATLAPDEFASNTIDLEIWARCGLTNGLTSPRVRLSSASGLSQTTYTSEWGAAYRPLAIPSVTGPKYDLVRLGTLTLPTDGPSVGLIIEAQVAGSGSFSMDYLAIVPAKQRALSPSGEPEDSSYPFFNANTGTTSIKTIRSDLSGLIAAGAATGARDSGLGGSPLELPPGNVDLFILLSTTAADDPTSNSRSMAAAVTASGSLRITPRYWVARGN